MTIKLLCWRTGGRSHIFNFARGCPVLIQANALSLPIADKTVQCCVTSPPYWGPRDITVKDSRNRRSVWTVNTQPYAEALSPIMLVGPTI